MALYIGIYIIKFDQISARKAQIFLPFIVHILLCNWSTPINGALKIESCKLLLILTIKNECELSKPRVISVVLNLFPPLQSMKIL